MTRRPDMKLNHKQSGFTIVEIMISMLLGLIMMVGVVSLVIGNKRSFQEQNETSRIQENARFAIQMLIEDIRMAGYVGCQPNQANDAAVNNNLNGITNDDFLLSMVNPIEGVENATGNWDASNSSSNDGGANGGTNVLTDLTTGTDAITVRYFVPTGVNTTANAGSGSVAVDSVTGLSQNMIAAIADCNQAEVFKITGAAGTTVSYAAGTTSPITVPGNADNAFTGTYTTGAEILGFKAVRYYIADVDTDGDGTDDSSSLFRYVYDNGAYTTQELISGVENMQILYGDGTNFRAANDGSLDWDDVTSVKIALLLRSEAEVGTDTDTRTYNLLGTTVNPADLRVRRRVFTATAQIRNRT